MGSNEPDPRIAHAYIVQGAEMLTPGEAIVIVDMVTVGGTEMHIPRPLAGMPELVTCREAESRAEELRAKLLSTLVNHGTVPWQPDTTLVVEMRAAAETTVTSAVVGLEAFAAHHVLRLLDVNTGTVTIDDTALTPQEVRGGFSLDDTYKQVLPALLEKASPAQLPWWQDLRRTQGLAALTRHAITEPVERKGLSGRRSLPERLYRGEYVGTAAMLEACFEYFSPNWVPQPLRGKPSAGAHQS